MFFWDLVIKKFAPINSSQSQAQNVLQTPFHAFNLFSTPAFSSCNSPQDITICSRSRKVRLSWQWAWMNMSNDGAQYTQGKYQCSPANLHWLLSTHHYTTLQYRACYTTTMTSLRLTNMIFASTATDNHQWWDNFMTQPTQVHFALLQLLMLTQHVQAAYDCPTAPWQCWSNLIWGKSIALMLHRHGTHSWLVMLHSILHNIVEYSLINIQVSV